MNKKEADDSICKGFSITHKYFTDEEYVRCAIGVGMHCMYRLYTNTCMFKDEHGNVFSREEFWKYRQDPMFADNWEIYQPATESKTNKPSDPCQK